MSEVSAAVNGQSQRSQLADAVAACVRAYTGRGPMSTRVLLNDETVVVVMRDTLTKGEQVLVDHGHDEEVLAIRGTYQVAMRKEVSAEIEKITGQPVVTFLSANSTDPDYAVEIFILGKPGEGAAHDGNGNGAHATESRDGVVGASDGGLREAVADGNGGQPQG